MNHQPSLSAIATKATNAVTLRTTRVSREDANLFSSVVLKDATHETIPDQIRAALKQRKARVIDLFRQLDDDESGLISAAEFVKAMHELGMKHAPPEALTAIS